MKERFQTPLNNTYQDCEQPFKNYNKNKKNNKRIVYFS